jgi:hypothetical protein
MYVCMYVCISYYGGGSSSHAYLCVQGPFHPASHHPRFGEGSQTISRMYVCMYVAVRIPACIRSYIHIHIHINSLLNVSIQVI